MARVRARTFLLLVPFRRFLDGRAVLELLACAMLSEVAIRALTWSLLIEQGSALDRSAARQLLVPVVYFAFGSAGTQAPLSMDARGCAHALRAKGRGRGRGSVKQGGRGGPTSSRTWARRAVGRSSRSCALALTGGGRHAYRLLIGAPRVEPQLCSGLRKKPSCVNFFTGVVRPEPAHRDLSTDVGSQKVSPFGPLGQGVYISGHVG